MRHLIALIAFFIPGAAFAADNVTLSSLVFVERTVADSAGHNRVILEEPKTVTPGDRLVFVLNYRNAGRTPASDFVVTNPLPASVAFQGATGEAQVSIDGGRRWGMLAALRVHEADGRWRNARPEDVTHLRWIMRQSVPAGAQGRISFRGIVR